MKLYRINVIWDEDDGYGQHHTWEYWTLTIGEAIKKAQQCLINQEIISPTIEIEEVSISSSMNKKDLVFAAMTNPDSLIGEVKKIIVYAEEHTNLEPTS